MGRYFFYPTAQTPHGKVALLPDRRLCNKVALMWGVGLCVRVEKLDKKLGSCRALKVG